MADNKIFSGLSDFGKWLMAPYKGPSNSEPAPEENINITSRNERTEVTRTIKGPSAFYGEYTGNNYLFNYSFTGEKNIGEMGPIKDYRLNYEALRLRSWQLYLESEIAQTVLKKFTTWIIGSGLKLQCEPDKRLLEEEGVKIDIEKFNNSIEARWSAWASSNISSYDGMMNLHSIAQEAHKNAIVGGDVLVILRLDKTTQEITVQLVDGCHVQSPLAGSEYWPGTLPNGNILINGIEMDERGTHIAYYVRKALPQLGWERVEARNSVGMVTAFMVYGNRFRLDNKRGMSLIACVMETMKKMERYKEATLGSAEERAKIVLFVKHELNAVGENPLMKQLATIHDADARTDQIPEDINGRKLADQVAATTNKSTYNMPPGSSLESLETKNDLYFKDFYTVNIDLVCACVEIPPNVAMSQYNDSFSASRAATKDWEHTIEVKREDFYHQFYKHIYTYWFTVNNFKLKISAPKFLGAYFEKPQNNMLILAYLRARFVGTMFPHIDPLKEANAERVKLGSAAAHIPLTTVERATEVLSGGDSDSNMRQFSEELEEAEELGIKAPLKIAAPAGGPPSKKVPEEA